MRKPRSPTAALVDEAGYRAPSPPWPLKPMARFIPELYCETACRCPHRCRRNPPPPRACARHRQRQPEMRARSRISPPRSARRQPRHQFDHLLDSACCSTLPSFGPHTPHSTFNSVDLPPVTPSRQAFAAMQFEWIPRSAQNSPSRSAAGGERHKSGASKSRVPYAIERRRPRAYSCRAR